MKEALGGSLVPVLLDQDIQYFAILVHRPPQILALPTNRDKHLIKMPGVAQPPLSMPKFVCKRLTELQTPQVHGLIANSDSTLG